MTEAIPWRKRAGKPLFLFFAVFIPALAWGIEVLTAACGDLILDPMPTLLHVALILLVPVANYTAYFRPDRNSPLLTGAATGVALIYTILFFPTFPIGVMAIVVGIGLLLLSPLFGLIGSVHCALRLRREGASMTGYWLGILLALVLIFAADIPVTVTQYAMARRDLPMLRTVGNRDVVLRACYSEWRTASDLPGLLVNFGRSVDPETARGLFYRMTGQPFNAFPRPPRSWRPHDNRQFDAELAGEEVGGRLRGLSLTDSQLRSKTDPKAAIAYTEWTMEFSNTGAPAEARAQVALPPGGVVSRVTLWVNGEEREAAFAAVEHARQAYEDVVNTRRDPLLVTTSGPDRVLVQCFPVPSKGTMKIRLGITAPAGRLPSFIERNFAIDTAHDVGGKTVNDLELVTLTNPTGPAQFAWSPHPDQGFVVAGLPEKAPPPRRVTLVVDGSASMAGALPEIAAALTPQVTRILFAGDEVQELTPEALQSVECLGGQDAVPALKEADRGEPELILWVHAQQPVELEPIEQLTHPVFSLQVGEGPNRVLEELDQVTVVPRTTSLKADLQSFLEGPPAPRSYTLTDRQPQGHRTDDHLVRLWAAAEAEKLRRAHKPEEAQKLALRHQLVTPLTGAVVLENQEQYEDAGLEPVDAGSVPTIPEPGVLLLLAALAAVGLRRR